MTIDVRFRTAAAIAASALALTACGTTSGTTSASGSCKYNIAFLGDETGDNAALGQHMVGGIKLALKEYNDMHKNATVCLKDFDSQGSPDKAAPLASKIVGDSSIIGLVGPGFSGESKATGPTFNQAQLPSISASATNVHLTQNGWTYWHRVIGNDAAQGAADAKYLTSQGKKVFVIDDASDYGKGLADVVRGALTPVGTDEVQAKQTDFSATVTKVKASPATAVFYGGYYAESSLLVKQLRQAGWKGTFMSGDGSEDPKFIEGAGADAAEGAWLSAPAGPAPADFSSKYKDAVGQDAGLYSTQAYDATKIFLAAIDAGKTSHADVNAFINSYTGDGVSGPIAFDSKGDVKQTTIYVYMVKGGKLDESNPTAVK